MKQAVLKPLIIALILIAISLVSIFGLSPIMSSPETYQGLNDVINEKRNTVLGLTGAVSAASIAITLLPDDIGSPLAAELSDVTDYMMIVLCILYLEKYLLTLGGYAVFSFGIPILCGMFFVYQMKKNRRIFVWMQKTIVLCVALMLVIPTSVWVTNIIEQTHEDSINQTITLAQNSAEAIEKASENEDASFFEGLWSDITDGVTSAISTVETSLNNLMESSAVLLITSCVIPMLVIISYAYIFKIVFGFNFLPQATELIQSRREKTSVRKRDPEKAS